MEGQILFNVGLFYEQNGDFTLMTKYYLRAVSFNNTNAMVNLGRYYFDIGLIDNMKRYYMRAIKLYYTSNYIKSGSNSSGPDAMNLLACYYEYNNEISLMKQYYLMAIELGHIEAMSNLGNYYRNIKEYDLMLKYYTMAIELNDIKTIHLLAQHYEHINDKYSMEQTYLKAVQLNNIDSMIILGQYYEDKGKFDLMKRCYLKAINLNSTAAMVMLGEFYGDIEDDDKNMIYYFFMALDTNGARINSKTKAYDCLVRIFHKILRYFINDNNKKMICYMLFVVNENNIYDVSNYIHMLRHITKEYRTQLRKVSKVFNGTIISNFFSRITKDFLYNPVYGRLFHKNVLFRYNKERYNIMYKLFKLIKIKLLRNAIIKLKVI